MTVNSQIITEKMIPVSQPVNGTEVQETPVYVKEILSFRFLVWAFFLFGILGVLIEGVFCIFFYGHWETHVTTFFGWYNALYSVGAVLYFFMAARMDHAALWKKVLAMTLVSTLLELLAGLLILRGLGMRAWDYNDTRFNFMGLIAPLYSLGWAIPALFVSLTYRKAGTSAAKLKSSFWKKAAVVLCILISADLLLAAVCMSRWSIRHYSGVSERPLLIERIASDDWMASRFVEWRFIE